MRTTLLSDAHLSALNDPVQADLVAFMREWRTDEWVFVGDILDFGWTSRTTVYLAHAPFWAALSEAIERGQRVVWVRGNHDFGVEPGALADLGVELCDLWTTTLGDRRVGALHGDNAANRVPEQILRRLARGRGARVVSRVLGPERLWRLATRLSNASRERHSASRLRQVLQRQERLVDRQLANGWDVCCVGHSHAPGVALRPGGGLHVNLGDWLEHRSFLLLDEEVTLYRWNEGQAQPIEGPPRRREEWGVPPC
jgi:UDP-2,3-diacylglucosamine pyrophosphatase LpxH